MARKNYNRPILLSIFAILLVLSGVIMAINGALLMVGGVVLIPINMPAAIGTGTSGGLTILFGIINILIGMALFSGKSWGWWFAVIMTTISLIFSIASLNLALLINLIVLIYLLMKNTRGWFGV